MGKHFARRAGSKVLRSVRRALVRSAIAVDPSPYQPVGDSLRKGSRSAAAFETRLLQVVRQIEATGARNLLDIGCSEGYFVRQLTTKLGIFALGIDYSEGRLQVARGVAEIYGESGYGFVNATADVDFVRNLPPFDIVLCFSMLHWVIRDKGVEGGKEFLQGLSRITRHSMIFDMGSPEEEGIVGEQMLAVFGGDVVASTTRFLNGAGFSTVEHVGNTEGAQKGRMRPLFVCYPEGTGVERPSVPGSVRGAA